MKYLTLKQSVLMFLSVMVITSNAHAEAGPLTHAAGEVGRAARADIGHIAEGVRARATAQVRDFEYTCSCEGGWYCNENVQIAGDVKSTKVHRATSLETAKDGCFSEISSLVKAPKKTPSGEQPRCTKEHGWARASFTCRDNQGSPSTTETLTQNEANQREDQIVLASSYYEDADGKCWGPYAKQNMNHEEAKDFCKPPTRLPTSQEFERLGALFRFPGKYDPSAFRGFYHAGLLWSSTVDPNDSRIAFTFDSGSGYMHEFGYLRRSRTFFRALCVRPHQRGVSCKGLGR